ncbi:uncharacterized protein [Miscanthus floridulus]|uniref:uncharacterized protein n=1 Tax=Miscanthus floridulus TaxID=154761 RepID=UPI00345AD8AC
MRRGAEAELAEQAGELCGQVRSGAEAVGVVVAAVDGPAHVADVDDEACTGVVGSGGGANAAAQVGRPRVHVGAGHEPDVDVEEAGAKRSRCHGRRRGGDGAALGRRCDCVRLRRRVEDGAAAGRRHEEDGTTTVVRGDCWVRRDSEASASSGACRQRLPL